MIKLMKSSFYKEKKTRNKLVDFILNTKILSMDKQCRDFEQNFAQKQQRKFAVFVNSGSSANLILIQSLLNLGWLKKNEKVGFSALTWSTNVMPLIQLGLNPIPLDCNLETLNTSPDNIEKNTDNLKALFITNALGFADDIEKIKNICEKNNIILLEDNCESLGSKINGKLLGNFGLASTFSFFVGHHLSTIEGGMICADDEDLYEMLVMTRAHGWDRNLKEKKKQSLKRANKISDFYARYTFYNLGFNTRPNEITGFLGNIQSDYWDEIVKKREKNFKLFQAVSEQNNDFIPLQLNHMGLISCFAMPVICKDKKTLEKYKNNFLKNGVEIRPIIAGNITRQPFFKKYIKEKRSCKNADFAHENGFYFSNDPELTDKEINLLISLLRK